MKFLRRLLMALLFSLLLGFAIGTVLRLKLERPVRYIGSAFPAGPLDVGDPRPRVFDPGQHEQQVG
jgi:hypothetical protein